MKKVLGKSLGENIHSCNNPRYCFPCPTYLISAVLCGLVTEISPYNAYRTYRIWSKHFIVEGFGHVNGLKNGVPLSLNLSSMSRSVLTLDVEYNIFDPGSSKLWN